jgi:ABC-type multidrug transport system fused ATPase/permease subunit
MHAGTFIATCLVGFIASFFNVLLPLSVGKFFELLYQEQSTKGKLLEMLSLPINDMQSFFIFFFSLIALRGVFGFFQNYLTAYTGERFIADLRVELFKAQLTMNLRHFEKRHLSRHLQKYTGDMRFIQKWMTKGVIGGPIDFFFLVFAFFALYQINPAVTLGLILSMFAAGIIMLFVSKIIGKSTERRNIERAKLLEFVADRLQRILSVKFFNREFVEVDRFKKSNDDFVATGKRTFIRQALLESMLPVIFFLIIVVVMWLSVKYNETNSPSNSLTFMLVLLYLQGAFRRILRIPAIWNQAKVSFVSLDRQLLKTRERRANKQALDDTYGLINFNNIQLESEHHVLLSNFSTLVHPNTLAFFEVENSEVRNSLLKVLGGADKLRGGEIKIDKDSIADFNPFQIRKNFAYVSQSLPLIGYTVFEAVSFYTTDEKRDKVNKVLSSLRFHEQYSGDRLAILLQGERPKLNSGDLLKLSFARAILTSKKTIILDNPFEGMDEATIVCISEVLNKLKQKRTIILMAPSCPEVLHFDKKVIV